MARRLRQFLAAQYFLVTDRCSEERFFLRPDEDAKAVIAAALRAAIEATGVGVVCFIVMGNHWHLLLRRTAEAGAIAAFMQRLKSEVARGVNDVRDRRGALWSGRYSAQPIVDVASVLGRMMYILMNPVAAGLAATAAEYVGLSSLEANLGIRGACGSVDVPIELPPQWAELDAAELAVQRASLRDELHECESKAKEARIAKGLPRPKAKQCLRVDPFARPERPKRKPAPACFAATEMARAAYTVLRRAFVEAFAAASEAFRGGVLDVIFPAGSFPPRLIRPPNEAAAA